MNGWVVHRLAFAVVVPTAVAAIPVWALFGTEGLRTLLWVVLMAAFIAALVFRIVHAMVEAAARLRPVEPEDRERRRRERDARRRAREVAMRRYGTVVRGRPRDSGRAP